MRSMVWFAGTRVLVRVTAADSEGRVGVWESEEPRGTALPLHTHTREDEQMVVLEGEVSVQVAEETRRLQPATHLRSQEACRTLTASSRRSHES